MAHPTLDSETIHKTCPLFDITSASSILLSNSVKKQLGLEKKIRSNHLNLKHLIWKNKLKSVAVLGSLSFPSSFAVLPQLYRFPQVPLFPNCPV